MQKEEKSDWQVIKEVFQKYVLAIPTIKLMIIPTFACVLISKFLEVHLGESLQDFSKKMAGNLEETSFNFLLLRFMITMCFLNMFSLLQGYIFAGPIQKSFRLAAKSTFKKYMSLSHTNFHALGSGEIHSSIERKSKAVADILDVIVLHIFPVVSIIVFSGFKIFFSLGKFPAIMLFVALVLYALITIRITKYRNKIRKLLNISVNDSSNLLYDRLINFDIILAYNNQELELQKYDDSLKPIQTHSTRLMKALHILNFVQRMVFSFINVLVIYCGINGILMDKITSDSLILYITISKTLSSNLSKLGYIYHRYTQAITDAKMTHENFFEISSQKALKYDLGKFENEIKFKEINFYRGSRMILNNISFTIFKGEKVAIAGKNGSGKSTLIKILLGFHEFQGKIFIDNTDFNSININSLRKIIGYVPQDGNILNESIKYNMQYGDFEAKNDRIVEVSDDFHIHDSIMKIDNSYLAVAGERGEKLSGGEKQKVALVRAVLKNPDILILDEPTASLDKESETDILNVLLSQYSDKTLIMIIHNIGLLKSFDKVVFLSPNFGIEVGSHSELLERKGEYYNFYMQKIHTQE
ncbi:ABC transporter [Hamiltosporidium magnivora]|uniref:ABC transporter n=1 Tax=Hamiltosporidium magnivora TaxID=148818 RepID=A0A4Q9LKL1_9MICR|nr:ABC transporter [Hamiltosporidium magnivora]